MSRKTGKKKNEGIFLTIEQSENYRGLLEGKGFSISKLSMLWYKNPRTLLSILNRRIKAYDSDIAKLEIYSHAVIVAAKYFENIFIKADMFDDTISNLVDIHDMVDEWREEWQKKEKKEATLDNAENIEHKESNSQLQ